ncbi:MAG: hypothetical protein KAR42_15175 [candidate division Zixibacteria bacterium]|nr:hypothetical protein [candidate division Zixibacteria bacterium]
MAKCYSHSLPGKLEKAIIAINSPVLKDSKGTNLIRKCSIPRKPTKKLPYKRLRPRHDPETFNEFYDYCGIDIKSEEELSKQVPDLLPQERKLWLIDQAINTRGVYIDQESLRNCIGIVEQATKKYTEELQDLTGGAVRTADETAKIKNWLHVRGTPLPDMQAETIKDVLDAGTIRGADKRVLEIRAMLGARSVKKLYAIKYRLSSDGRIRGLFQFAGADRTGRWAGRGPQPQNLPSGGPEVRKCPVCSEVHWSGLAVCPSYNQVLPPVKPEDILDWGIKSVETVLKDMSTGSLDQVEALWGNPIAAVSGCLRGLFTAAQGHDLICSDYNSIEAMALAELAGEEWRQEVFRSHGKIYEMSASKISGIPFEEILNYKKRTKKHHPLRKRLGKVAELASGYGGSIGAWKVFGADKYMTDQEITANVKKWRAESPSIVKYWYATGDAAINAVQNPGSVFTERGISWGMKSDILYCKLLSGRLLTYHKPRLTRGQTPYGREIWDLSYMGWNSDYKKGPIGWLRIRTYGAKLVENITQATCRDILGYSAMANLESHGYPLVLHVHDEPVAEVRQGWGSIKEFEGLMCVLSDWCIDWPVKATDGWRGLRFRKG